MRNQPLSLIVFSSILSLAGTLRAADSPVAQPTDFNVRAFGATGDGKTLDTAAVNKAIDAAAAAGGGSVVFPAGDYLCYSIHLKSHVALVLGHGAILHAAPNLTTPDGYDAFEPNAFSAFQDFGHTHWHNGFLWGEKLEDISITGSGEIWGEGLSRGDPPAGGGDKSISLRDCKNVTLRDISILHGGHFAILVTGVDNLTIDNLKIDTNRDGMDIDCCRNVRISNCTVNSPTDDGICLKSCYALGYNRACENVSISDCFVTGGYVEGSVLDATYKRANRGGTGRIKFGTESNGGFKNIAITNCIFDYCGGLALEIVDGGTIDGCTISNITMRDITNMPIFIRLGDRARGPNTPPPGFIKHVNISNIVCTSCASQLACIISGIPGHEIEDLKLSDIRLIQRGGKDKASASEVLPENEKDYPEPTMFTTRSRQATANTTTATTTPSWGFYLRHVNGVEMNNVNLSLENPDGRPAFALIDVQHALFNNINLPKSDVPDFAQTQVDDFERRP